MTLPVLHKQKHTATKEESVTGQVVIYKVEVHANGGNADIELTDALTDTGGDDLMYSKVNGTDGSWDYTNLGGVIFNTGLTVVVTGTGATVFIWTDVVQIAT